MPDISPQSPLASSLSSSRRHRCNCSAPGLPTWICTNLRELDSRFQFHPPQATPVLQPLVFDHLSRLTRRLNEPRPRRLRLRQPQHSQPVTNDQERTLASWVLSLLSLILILDNMPWPWTWTWRNGAFGKQFLAAAPSTLNATNLVVTRLVTKQVSVQLHAFRMR